MSVFSNSLKAGPRRVGNRRDFSFLSQGKQPPKIQRSSILNLAKLTYEQGESVLEGKKKKKECWKEIMSLCFNGELRNGCNLFGGFLFRVDDQAEKTMSFSMS